MYLAERSYNCNERIILSGIAFLTLPEIVEELHKRLPAISVPRLPPKRIDSNIYLILIIKYCLYYIYI